MRNYPAEPEMGIFNFSSFFLSRKIEDAAKQVILTTPNM